MLIDSHAHLDHPKLFAELSSVLERASDAGVAGVLSIFCIEDGPGQVESALRMVEKLDGVYASIGVHPHDALSMTDEVEDAIFSAMSHPKVIGWGEIGLDFYYDHSPRAVQVEVFQRQLTRARQAGKPVIIHSRDSEEDTCRILEQHLQGADDCLPGVMHCFSYSAETANRCLDLGFFVGFGGILTFPRSEELRRVASLVPADRILIETDAPYLAPVPFRGKTNEPAYVARVAENLGKIRQVPPGAIGELTAANFCRLFGLNRDFQRLH